MLNRSNWHHIQDGNIHNYECSAYALKDILHERTLQHIYIYIVDGKILNPHPLDVANYITTT